MSKRKKPDTPRLPFDPDRVAGDEPENALPQPVSNNAAPPQTGNSSGVDPSPPRTLSVSEFTRLVKSAIAQALPAEIRVIGELSNVSRPAGGHIYFTLKDAASELRCVMWRSSAASLRFDLKDGLEVVAVGAVDVYEPRGQYQFYVRRMSPCGAGALDLAFQQLKKKLADEGLFDSSRKRRLPRFPATIGVVTSPTGAAVHDMTQTMARRYPTVRILIFGVRVQGDGAANEIADAVRRINRSRDELGGVDILIVGRGGGSLEDLWAFNEEIVARAIHASEIPVISAVGHDVDFTIADFVADIRAATPTAAGELAVPVMTEIIDAFDLLTHRLRRAMSGRVESARLRLQAVQRSDWFRDPIEQVRRIHQCVDELLGRIRLAAARQVHRLRARLHEIQITFSRVQPAVQVSRRRERAGLAESRLLRVVESGLIRRERRLRACEVRLARCSPLARVELIASQLAGLEESLRRGGIGVLAKRADKAAILEARLKAASHESVLGRGFSITRRRDSDEIVRTASEVVPDDELMTQTADGVFASRVIDNSQVPVR